MPFNTPTMSLTTRVTDVSHTSAVKSKIPWTTTEACAASGKHIKASRWVFDVKTVDAHNEGTLKLTASTGSQSDLADDAELQKSIGKTVQLLVTFSNAANELMTVNITA